MSCPRCEIVGPPCIPRLEYVEPLSDAYKAEIRKLAKVYHRHVRRLEDKEKIKVK